MTILQGSILILLVCSSHRLKTADFKLSIALSIMQIRVASIQDSLRRFVRIESMEGGRAVLYTCLNITIVNLINYFSEIVSPCQVVSLYQRTMLWTLSFSVACVASCIIPVKMESEMMTIHFSSVRISLNSTSTYVYQSTDLPQQTACSDTANAENGTETQTNKSECQMVTIGSTAVFSPYWWQILQVKNWHKYGPSLPPPPHY